MQAPILIRPVRIVLNRISPRLGLAAGILLAALAAGARLLAVPWWPGTAASEWAALIAGLAIAAACALGLFAQLPIIEVSELGVTIWLNGAFHKPFFAPWKQVRRIGRRQIRLPSTRAPIDALCIEFVEDLAFRLPDIAAGPAAPLLLAGTAELAWPARSLAGPAPRWAEAIIALQSGLAR